MKQNVREMKMFENLLVVVALFVIIMILLPIINNIIDMSLASSAESGTTGAMENVKDLYSTINLTGGEVHLPFRVSFHKKGYTVYSDGVEYGTQKNIQITVQTQLPEDGYVQLNTDGSVSVKDLKFGKYICNTDSSKNPICVKKTEVEIAQSVTEDAIENIKKLYSKLEADKKAQLPFKVVFDKNGYTVYSNNKKYDNQNDIKFTDSVQLPDGGFIELSKDGKIKIDNLKVDNCTCNLDKDNKPVCVKK